MSSVTLCRVHVLLATDFDHAQLAQWRAALAAAMPEARWLDAAEARAAPDAVQAAVVANPPPGSLAGWPRLALIQSLWAGVEKLLADPTLPPQVPLARMVDPAMSTAMAETVLWAVLWLQRDFVDYVAQQRARRWRPLPQRRADEVRVLVLGLGEMGRCAAAALAARGYAVRGWAREAAAADGAGPARIAGRGALWPALHETDIVVNLLPLTGQTSGLVDARFLAALPRGAALVNLARGAHVVEADLLAALDAGHLRHAVLDVHASEPLPAEHAFWGHERVTVLPHIAAQTDPRSAAAVAVANLRAARAGRPLAHLVDRRRGY